MNVITESERVIRDVNSITVELRKKTHPFYFDYKIRL